MGIHSKVWGQYLWRLLHSITYSYDPKMPDELKDKYEKFFNVLKDFLPCPVCREHYKQRCSRNPPENNMRSTEQFVLWLNNLHNEVNAGLGKPLVSLREANNNYVRDGRLTYDFNDLITLFKIMSLIKNLNFPAIRKFLILLFEIYPENILIQKTPKSYRNIVHINNNPSVTNWINSFSNEFFNTGPVDSLQNIPNVYYNKKDNPNNNVEIRQTSRLVKTDIQEFLKKYKLI